jgi:hypothetical protein
MNPQTGLQAVSDFMSTDRFFAAFELVSMLAAGGTCLWILDCVLIVTCMSRHSARLKRNDFQVNE